MYFIITLQVLYTVVHVPWMEPSAVKELLWRRHVYNNAILSLRRIFREEIAQKQTGGEIFFSIFLNLYIEKIFPVF